MINKIQFLNSIAAIKEFCEFDKVFARYGYGVLDDSVSSRLIDQLIDVLYAGLPAAAREEDLIEEFCWGYQFCEDGEVMNYRRTADGDIEFVVRDSEDLWDLIQKLGE